VNCSGCGTELGDHSNPELVNQKVDGVLPASITGARQRGGVCPLCGHPRPVRFYKRESFLPILLVSVWVLLGAFMAITSYARSPIRSPLAQEMLARASQDSRVQASLGSPIRSGLFASGSITTDQMGWSEAKLNIPLHGPRASATLRVTAGRGEGPWVISTLEVQAPQEPQPIILLRRKAEVTGDQRSGQTQPAMTPALLDAITPPPESDGAYPVVRFTMASDARGVDTLRSSLAIRKPHLLDHPEDVFEVDLRSGTFVLRRTDLYVDDSIPLVFTRIFHTWGRPNWDRDGNWAFKGDAAHPAFGAGSTHSYDICPMGTRFPYTLMDLYLGDGTFLHMNRISQGTGYADAWFEQTAVSAEFYKARLWWNGSGWTLHFQDGTIYQFPDGYYSTNLAQGAAFEMRNPQGQRVQFIRDAQRNLRRLVSPAGRWISLDYDTNGQVSRAQDDDGHAIDYAYDSQGRLIRVRDNRGPDLRYIYDSFHLGKMMAIESGNGTMLLRNSYDAGGRITRQVTADGTEYGYRYVYSQGAVAQAVVTTPEHKDVTFDFEHDAAKPQWPPVPSKY
jgi:YD repeat-containing protein